MLSMTLNLKLLCTMVTSSKSISCEADIVETTTETYILRNNHDDVIKWKHFPRYWPFRWGIHRSPVNSPHKGQRRGALMFPLICVWVNGWVNNREAGDLRRYHAHYDVTVMIHLKMITPGSTLWSEAFWALISNYILSFPWDAIVYPCSNLNGGLVESQLKS